MNILFFALYSSKKNVYNQMMEITCVQFSFFSLTPDSSASVPFDLCVCLMHRLILDKRRK